MEDNKKQEAEKRLKEQLRKQTNDIFNLFGNNLENTDKKNNTQNGKELDR